MDRGATRARSSRFQIAAVEGQESSRVDAMGTGGQPADTAMCSGTTTKRVIDVTLAAAGLVLTAPLMIGLGVLVSLDSPGPALFLQRRPGRSRAPFTIVKLRTMDAQGRVTSVGRFLRPMGLDELPQLWNVLKGDMSLIGPRPEVLERVERYEREIPGYRDRYQIRPGITGWAQVNGLRGDNKVSIAERLRFDIQYLREWSPALDGRILLRTVSTVLRDTLRSFRE
jgi:putative colanic acid biosynthesis UDP-glucose lipid carrier transferase